MFTLFKKANAYLLLVCFVASGCIYSREIVRTEKDIEREFDAELRRNAIVNVGPVTVGLARAVMRYIDDDDVQLVRYILGDVKRMKFGIFDVRRAPESGIDVSTLDRFDDWEIALKVRDESDEVYLMYRENEDAISDIFLFLVEDDQLVIARASGHLDHAVSEIIAEYESN